MKKFKKMNKEYKTHIIAIVEYLLKYIAHDELINLVLALKKMSGKDDMMYIPKSTLSGSYGKFEKERDEAVAQIKEVKNSE